MFYCFKVFKALSYWVFVLFYLFFPACPKKPNKTEKNPTGLGFLKKKPGFFLNLCTQCSMKIYCTKCLLGLLVHVYPVPVIYHLYTEQRVGKRASSNINLYSRSKPEQPLIWCIVSTLKKKLSLKHINIFLNFYDCYAYQCQCQSNIYIAPIIESRIWGAGVWVTRRDRQKRKGEI